MSAKANIDKNILYDFYILKNYSIKEISEFFKVSTSTICNHLKKYNIKKDRELITEKITETNLSRFGSNSPFGNTKIREKSFQTKLKKYGDGYFNNHDKAEITNIQKYNNRTPLCNTDVLEKIKKTNLEKYGSKNPFGSKEIQEKIKKTNLEKYGVENISSLESIKNKKRENYKNSDTKEKTIKTNIERYGVPSVSQRNIKNFQNYNIDYVRNNFIKDGRFLAKDFRDYFNISSSNVNVFKNNFNIEEPSKKLFGEAEDKFYSCLQENIKTKIYRQYKIFNKFTDFYFILNDTIVLNKIILNKNEKIVIEYLGDLHHGYSNDETTTYLHKTASQLYKETFERFKFLLSHNDVDRVLYAWHSEFISNNIKALKEYKL